MKKIGLFAAGVLFDTAGLKILGCREAKKVYTGVTAAALRAKDCVMDAVTTVRENAEDIYADAKEQNERRAAELAEDVVESIARMQPERVVYVSCDSATMARDVKRFAALGYRAVRACAVDLFPRADHVEAVVLMSRKDK